MHSASTIPTKYLYCWIILILLFDLSIFTYLLALYDFKFFDCINFLIDIYIDIDMLIYKGKIHLTENLCVPYAYLYNIFSPCQNSRSTQPYSTLTQKPSNLLELCEEVVDHVLDLRGLGRKQDQLLIDQVELQHVL